MISAGGLAAREERQKGKEKETNSKHGFLRRVFNFMRGLHKLKGIGGVDAAAYYPFNSNNRVSFVEEPYMCKAVFKFDH